MANNLVDELYTLCDRLTEALSDINPKLKNGKPALPSADLDYVDRLTHAIKSIKTTIAMEEAYDNDDYSDAGHSMRYDRSYARGRHNARRDSMGRYSRDDYDRGYSRGMAKHEMVDELRDMMKQTDDERMRQEMQTFISKMENMR